MRGHRNEKECYTRDRKGNLKYETQWRTSEMACDRLTFQHSPSNYCESQFQGEVLDFGRWQSFGKGVGHHVIGWAINQMEMTVFDNIANEVKTDVNILGASMILMVFCQCNG